MSFEDFKNKIKQYKTRHPFVFYFLIIYLGGLLVYSTIYIIYFANHKALMSLNEVGDFLSGSFAPLAFLFLFLGFKQQGDSIKQTNLNISEQLNQQARMLTLQENEHIQKEHATQPILDLIVEVSKVPEIIYHDETFKTKPDSNGIRLDFRINNTGEKISEVIFLLTGDIQELLNSQSSLKTDNTLVASTLLSKNELESFDKQIINFTLNIEYRTSLGIRYSRKYNIECSPKTLNVIYDYNPDYIKLPMN